MAGTNGPFRMIIQAFTRPRAAAGVVTGCLRPALRAVRPAWQITTPAGRGVLVVAVAAWLLGVRLGWQEQFLVAACSLLALLIAAVFVCGRPALDNSIELYQPRVGVGVPATGRVVAANRSRARLRALGVEVPV